MKTKKLHSKGDAPAKQRTPMHVGVINNRRMPFTDCFLHEALGCRVLPALAPEPCRVQLFVNICPTPRAPVSMVSLSLLPLPPAQPQQPESVCLSRKPKWKQQTHHRLPAGHAEGRFLTPAGNVGRIFLQFLQELPDRLAVVGNLAFLQERF